MISFIKTALAFLTTYKKYAGILLIVAACALSSWVTYTATQAHYDAEKAAFMQKIYAKQASQKDEYERRLSEATSKLVLESRRADANRVERDNLLGRLRVANARADRADTDSTGIDREQYARCRKFLEEGAGLLAEGDDLARRVAREKDALAEIVR